MNRRITARSTMLPLWLPAWFGGAFSIFLLRQFFLTIPDELAEAARIDGAGPMRFFFDVLLPLSKTSIAALFVIQFIYGWNQYLWPLLMTTSEDMYPVVMGIRRMLQTSDAATEWNAVMATAMLAMIPPDPTDSRNTVMEIRAKCRRMQKSPATSLCCGPA